MCFNNLLLFLLKLLVPAIFLIFYEFDSLRYFLLSVYHFVTCVLHCGMSLSFLRQNIYIDHILFIQSSVYGDLGFLPF